jgi:hypothetical protein
MVIPIPIPIGMRRVAVTQAAVWKLVSCESCHQPYAYCLELEAKGEDHDVLFLDAAGSAERARANAQENLRQQSRNCVLPVPCPHCGFYQAEMTKRLREEKSVNPLQITGAVVTVLALLLLLFGTFSAYVLTAVLAAIGLGLLCYGYVVAFRFDPNAADRELRKAVGRRSAVWGDKLAELMRARETGESAEAAPHSPAVGSRRPT